MKNHLLIASAFLFFAVGAAGGRAALAQAACAEDDPPRPPDVPQPSSCIDGERVCPDEVPGEYTEETIPYDQNDDVGPCGGKDAFCPSNCADSRASCDPDARGGPRCRINLVGKLFTPVGAATKGPAVVLVPGSTSCAPGPFDQQPYCTSSCTEGSPGNYSAFQFCGLRKHLLNHGYRVFLVYPRGYSNSTQLGSSTGATAGYTNAAIGSTGTYTDLRAAQQVAHEASCGTLGDCSTDDLKQEGAEDVVKAIQTIAARSDVSAVAVLGHSYGGERTLSANAHAAGQFAAVSISAGAETWCAQSADGTYVAHTETQKNLEEDVKNKKTPIFFLQPKNDVSLGSTIHLSHDASEQRSDYQSAIYPPVHYANGEVINYGNDAHSCFVVSDQSTDVWAPAVLDFLGRYGVK